MAKNKNVLIIDDDSDDIEIFSAVLLEIDPSIQIDAISDSTTALAELSDGNKPHPDFILLDINMPKIDGFECLRLFSQLPLYKAVPVIIFSTSRNPIHKAKAMQLGATDYLEKPNTLEELKCVLQKYLSSGVREI